MAAAKEATKDATNEATDTPKGPKTRVVPVIALTTAFYEMQRYRRGARLDITVTDGQKLPRWCTPAKDVPRDRDGQIDLDKLPIYQPPSVE